MDPRTVQVALQEAGDHAGAFLWRRICRDLEGPLRVVVAAREHAVARRLVVRLLEALPEADISALHVEGHGDEEAEPSLGAQDHLLAAHVLLWATPLTAALGSWERQALAALDAAGAPAQRAVVLADAHLLERLSDDPAREGAEVRERVTALVSEGWVLEEESTVAAWLLGLVPRRPEIVPERQRAVSRLLLLDALRGLDDRLGRAREELERVEELLAAEQAHLDQVRRRGERAAAHMLGAMRRNTEQMLVDLREFLVRLEADLPAQVEAVDDVDVVRRTLAHWLHHVVEAWMSDRLATWRADVLQELLEVQVDEAEIDRAELLVPALHPPPVRGEPNWTRRLGATAAMGGGAAMLLLGLWIPGLLAVTGGAAWSTFAQRSEREASRRKLVETAIDAIRQMGGDAERLLRDQITQLEEELRGLGEERVTEAAAHRAAQRAELEERRLRRRAHADDLRGLRDTLAARIAEIAPDELEATA